MPRAWCATAARCRSASAGRDALAQGLVGATATTRSFHAIMKRLAPGTEPLAALETGPFEKGLYGVSEMLFEAFLGLLDAGILKRDVDGVVLHGAVLSRTEIVLSRVARDAAGSARTDPDDAGVVHQRALWRRKWQNVARASMPASSTSR